MGANTSTRDEYRYDRVSRLREANLKSFSPIKNQKYDFDAYGNLVRVTTGSTVENFHVCTNGPTQPHEYCQNQSPTNRLLDGAYDEAGNLTQWGNLKYEFDLLNTLHFTLSDSGGGWEFIYNADDERVLAFQTGGTQTIWTLRDLQGQVLRRVATEVGIQYTTSIQTDYIRRGTLLLGAITTSEGGPVEWLSESTSFGTGTTRHFALDHLGSVRLISSATGTTIGKHTYYPFGREATPSLDAEPMKFANHERDGFENGLSTGDDLDYMHARFFSPTFSKFLSVDPAKAAPGAPQTWNRYNYAGANPLKYVDPDGRNAVTSCSATTCTATVEGQIVYDPNLSDQAQAAQTFKLAAETYWNSQVSRTGSGKTLLFDVSLSLVELGSEVAGVDTLTVVSGPGVAKVNQTRAADGSNSPDTGTIYTVDASGNPSGLWGVAPHEVGHLMGLAELPTEAWFEAVPYSPGPQYDIMHAADPSNLPHSAFRVASPSNWNVLVLGTP